jgi:dienelactone hydrolase
MEAPMTGDPGEEFDSTEAATRELIADLARGDMGAASEGFDEAMRSALSPERLEQVWRTVEAGVGPLIGVVGVRLERRGQHRLSIARCRFQRGDKLVKVAYDSRGRVVGLFFVDAPFQPAWTLPTYANPATFEERSVVVGRDPELPGVLSLPRRPRPVPGVVLVHGSGPLDADETVGGAIVFKDIAFGLASRGIAVLRYAKRTLVAPAGVVTVKEEVIDGALAAIDLLAKAPEVDPERIVVLGHSLGGYLAPRIAHADSRVAGLVILAGNARPIQDVLIDQLRYLVSMAPDKPALNAALEEARHLKAVVEDPTLRPDRPMPRLAGGVTGAYFLDLRSYRPDAVAASLTCPMLIVRGDRDYQVTSADFETWKGALGGQSNVSFKQYQGLNHVFVAGSGPSTPAEYERPDHVEESLINDIGRWIAAAVPARGQ